MIRRLILILAPVSAFGAGTVDPIELQERALVEATFARQAEHLEPTCFGEKMGDFEMTSLGQFHNQLLRGTCSSHAVMNAFESAGVRENVDPKATPRPLSTAFAEAQSCEIDDPAAVKERLKNVREKFPSTALKFFEGSRVAKLARALITMGKIPYAGSATDRESRVAQIKMTQLAANAAADIARDLEAEKKKTNFYELTARWQINEEEIAEITANLEKETVNSRRDSKAQSASDVKAYREKVAPLVQRMNQLKAENAEVNMLRQSMYMMELKLMAEASATLCRDGKCIVDLRESAAAGEYFDASRLRLDEFTETDTSLCNPGERLAKLMHGACLGIPAIVSTDSKEGYLSRTRTNQMWSDHATASLAHATVFKGIGTIRGARHLIFSNSWGGDSEIAIPINKICRLSEINTPVFKVKIRGEDITEDEIFSTENAEADPRVVKIYRARRNALLKKRAIEPIDSAPPRARLTIKTAPNADQK